MSNHFHLLATVGDVPLGIPMQQLLTRHASDFNRRHERSGHLFQDRYKAIELRHDHHLVRTIAYIHLNPVRAEMVARPGEWPWSSHREFITGEGGMLELEHLEEKIGWNTTALRQLHEELIEAYEKPCDELSEVIEKAALAAGVESAALRSGQKGAAFTHARKLVLKWANSHTLSEIARALNCSRAALWQLAKTM